MRPSIVSLAPGESLVLYTDGITEAMNAAGELYGSRRLLAMLSSDVDGVSLLGPPHPRRREAIRRRTVAERRHVPDVSREGQGPVANREVAPLRAP